MEKPTTVGRVVVGTVVFKGPYGDSHILVQTGTLRREEYVSLAWKTEAVGQTRYTPPQTGGLLMCWKIHYLSYWKNLYEKSGEF